MDDAPLEIEVGDVDGWLTVVTAAGEWLYPRDEVRSRLLDALRDTDRGWFVFDLMEVTFGCEEMVDTLGLVAQTTRRRAGGLAVVCTGMVRRAVEISSGGTAAVCDTVDQAKELLEARRREVETEFDPLLRACRELPQSSYREDEGDYVSLLMMATFDLQMVRNHLEFPGWARPDLEGLRLALAGHPDGSDGNLALARTLWSNDQVYRAEILRRLVRCMDTLGVGDCRTLRGAMEDPFFPANIAEAVPGLTDTAHDLMRLRLGLPALRPTRQLRKFVEGILRRRLEDFEITTMLEVLAHRLDLPLAELHWRIWQYRQG